MTNMGYCRHQNTFQDLADLWEHWEDGAAAGTEYRYRHLIIQLVREMNDQFEDDGTYGADSWGDE